MEGKKVPPSLCCCTAEEEEEEEGDLISSPSSPPLPFPGGIRSGNISSSSSESILPLYCVGGGVSPLPSFSFRDDFLASFLGVEINDAVTIPKPKPNRKAVEFKVFQPFFPSLFNSFLFDRGFFFLCRRQRMA